MHSRGTTTTRGLTAARGRVRLAGMIASVLAIAGLTGCTGDDPTPTPAETTPAVEQTPSPRPTPTPTPVDPSSVPPERPEAMDTVDTPGAQALAEYYVRLVPYAEATGDVAALQALSHDECVFCGSILQAIADRSALGQHNSGGVPTIAPVQALEVERDRWWSVDLEVTQAPVDTLDASGAVVASQAEAVRYHMNLAIIHGNDGWQIREVSYEVLGNS